MGRSQRGQELKRKPNTTTFPNLRFVSQKLNKKTLNLKLALNLVFFYKKKLLSFALTAGTQAREKDKRLKKSNQLFFYSLSINSCFYNSNFLVVRPLFALTRFDIKKLCNLWKLPLYPDHSNQSLYFCRNRIRNQILPSLRLFF